MLNFAIILANGIEGWGVTRFAIEQQTWLHSMGHKVDVFATQTQKYASGSAQPQLKNLTNFSLEDDISFNNYDRVIINSLPYERKTTTQAQREGWNRILAAITAPVILIQHDNLKGSITKTFGLQEAVDKSAIIFSLSKNNHFAKLVNSSQNLDRFFGTKANKVCSFQPGIDFDAIRSVYWKDINEHDTTHHKWVGRMASCKGYMLMLDWSKLLIEQGYRVSLEGCDKSPAFIPVKQKFQFNDRISSKSFELDGDPSLPFIFGNYKNSEMLERLSRCGFGYQLTKFPPEHIDRHMEYTHQEIVASGCIPVFRKDYGDACRHRITGDPVSKTDSGTIWLDNGNHKEVLDTIRKLSSDSVLRNETREKAYEFWKGHQDASHTFKELHEIIESELC